MDVSLKQLAYFIALAEEGGFRAAADRVHVTQPALSIQIRELEDRLGAKLVERLPRAIRLTRAGNETLTRARRILGEMRDLEQAVRLGQGLRGRISLGVIPTVAPYLLPLALTRLRALDLTLDIRVREAQTSVLMEALAKGRLDAAIVALPVEEPGVATTPLFEDRFLLAASTARIGAIRDRAEEMRPETLSPSQLLLLDEGHCLADQALAVCGIASRRQIDLSASSLSTLVGLVSEGLGLTLLPEIAVRHECAISPNLSLLRFAAPEPARQLALVHGNGADGSGWIGELAGILTAAGEELTGAARAGVPVAGRPTALAR